MRRQRPLITQSGHLLDVLDALQSPGTRERTRTNRRDAFACPPGIPQAWHRSLSAYRPATLKYQATHTALKPAVAYGFILFQILPTLSLNCHK